MKKTHDENNYNKFEKKNEELKIKIQKNIINYILLYYNISL